MAVTQTLGRPPRINYVLSSDYAEPMAGNAIPPASVLTLHLEVPLTAGEAKALEEHLAKNQRKKAEAVVQAAAARLVSPNNPAGKGCRALIRAAFDEESPSPGARAKG